MIHLKREIKKHILQVLIGIVILAVVLVQLEKFNGWFLDVSIILISLILGGYNAIQSLKNKNFIAYLILANLFVMIATIHLLRLIFGGLLC